jgi:hypothetical protein
VTTPLRPEETEVEVVALPVDDVPPLAARPLLPPEYEPPDDDDDWLGVGKGCELLEGDGLTVGDPEGVGVDVGSRLADALGVGVGEPISKDA